MYYAKSVFLVLSASLGWINNVSGLILSVPTNQKLIIFLTTMNEELLQFCYNGNELYAMVSNYCRLPHGGQRQAAEYEYSRDTIIILL